MTSMPSAGGYVFLRRTHVKHLATRGQHLPTFYPNGIDKDLFLNYFILKKLQHLSG